MATNSAEVETNDGVDDPLLDTINVAIKRMLARSKERGYVTVDEINETLPPEEVSSEQIEDTMAMFSEMGINVVESEESEEPVDDKAKSVVQNKAPRRDELVGGIRIHGRSRAHVSTRNGACRPSLARR